MRKYLFIILGVSLGVISVAIGKVPPAVASWSGMTILGNNVGYLLASLIVAYLCCEKFLKSFLLSAATVVIASFVYYGLIFIFAILEIGYTESFPDIIRSLIFWIVVSVICGALSAISMHIVRRAKIKALRIITLIFTYTCLIFVIYRFEIISTINFRKDPTVTASGYLTGYFAGRNYIADIYSIIFAFVLVTIFFIIALKKTLKDKSNTVLSK